MNNRNFRPVKTAIVYGLLIIASLFIIVPILWMFATAMKTDQGVMSLPVRWIDENMSFRSFIRIWTDYPFPLFFRNSFVIVISSMIVSLFFSCLAGYGVSRFNFTGKKAFLAFILITQLFPSVMLLVPFYQILKIYGLSNTHLGLILVYISSSVPFCSWLMYGYYDTIPRELDDAAAIDGCSKMKTFWIIITPLARPGIAATAIYSFLTSWNEYMFATVLTNGDNVKTVPVGIGRLIGEYRIAWNDMMSASLMASIPLLILFIFFQKHLINALTAGAVKS